MNLVRVSSADGNWERILEQWRSECDAAGEDFDLYEPGAFSILRPLAEGEQTKDAGVYALFDDSLDQYVALCQMNVASLPKTTGRTLRVRMSMLSPNYDFGAYSIDDYTTVLTSIIVNTWMLSNSEMPAEHIKFHVRSPADVEFYRKFSDAMNGSRVFKSVQTKGSWLYMSK